MLHVSANEKGSWKSTYFMETFRCILRLAVPAGSEAWSVGTVHFVVLTKQFNEKSTTRDISNFRGPHKVSVSFKGGSLKGQKRRERKK